MNSITNRKRWNSKNVFTAEEAACLALGRSPKAPHFGDQELLVLVRRMKKSWDRAAYWHDEQLPGEDPPLFSTTDERYRLAVDLGTDDVDSFDYKLWRESARFHQQRFRREALAGWLIGCGIRSEYEFVAITNSVAQPSAGGSVDQTSLADGAYEAVKRHFFGAGKPENPPTSEEASEFISEWLESRGLDRSAISATMRERIHSVMRPDNVRPGPRSKTGKARSGVSPTSTGLIHRA